MPFPHKPDVPAGVTYTGHATKNDGSSDTQHNQTPGPEFPQTAAARKSSVTEEDSMGTTVIDDGTVEDSGPEVPRTAAARPGGFVAADAGEE